MSHSHSRLWIHAMWSTLDRLPLIHSTADQLIYKFLKGDFHEMRCPVKTIKGIDDQIHVLFLLNPPKSLAEIINQPKGSSYHYINRKNRIPQKFSWQTSSASSAVGGTLGKKDSLCSETQKERTVKKSFQSKYNEIVKNHKFEMEI